jgi:hypothetical protein
MTTTTSSSSFSDQPDLYEPFLAKMQQHFEATVKEHGPHLFTTDSPLLYGFWHSLLPAGQQQEYTCSCCTDFVRNFGSLVAIDKKGRLVPAIWPEEAPGIYAEATAAVRRVLTNSNVTGVFLHEAPVWGVYEKGGWTHMHIKADKVKYTPTLLTAFQASAQKNQDYLTLLNALDSYSLKHVEKAITLLRTDALYRSEKVLGVAEWFAKVHEIRASAKGNAARNHLTWLSVAGAPPGFCNVRSSMIGTLLEDISAKMNFDQISNRFAAKMHPLQYQRPQAEPKAGNIRQAEGVFEKLKSEHALARRFARLEDLTCLWKPAAPPPSNSKGLFSHLLQPKDGKLPNPEVPRQKMTWEKFQRTVLPDAQRMELLVPAQKAFFCSLVTATNPDAPPILQWDSEHHRNPVSWYVYHTGSLPAAFNLTGNVYHPVTAITLQPNMWQGKFPHMGEAAIFILRDCKDLGEPGLCLFPEILKTEYRGIRSTLEAYSKGEKISGKEEASAAGLRIGKNDQMNVTVRVATRRDTVDYLLDRWD